MNELATQDAVQAMMAAWVQTGHEIRKSLSIPETLHHLKRGEALQTIWEKIQAGKKRDDYTFAYQQAIAEGRILDQHRLGELLREMEKQHGARPPDTGLHDASPPTLADLGIEYTQSHRWQKIASIALDKLEAEIQAMLAAQRELTTAAMLRLADKRERQPPQPLPPGQYRVIYADPPWEYSNAGLGGSAEQHYPTMSMDDLCALPVSGLRAEDAVLFLWVTSPQLANAFPLIASWGFEYKTSLVWVKDKPTYGKLAFYVRSRHELLLIATRGSCLPRCDELPESLIESPRTEHSRKPALVYETIERMYAGPYVELFARTRRDGWESWGNEVDKWP